PLAILSASLSIMHPPLYNASHQAMWQLSEWSAMNDPEMLAVLQHWPVVYTNISMIANWLAPLHCNPQSCADWYNMLISVSNYSKCILDIPSLGIQFDYQPGTVVAFSGQLLWHGVNDVSGNCCHTPKVLWTWLQLTLPNSSTSCAQCPCMQMKTKGLMCRKTAGHKQSSFTQE
ncbi:hypothetical protein BKA82DRAFT_3967452, partial [Pisolithus tinctorius]